MAKLLFTEGTLAQTLAQLKEKLDALAPNGRVPAAALVRRCRSRKSRH
jgi:TBCC domain-containing protein 1